MKFLAILCCLLIVVATAWLIYPVILRDDDDNWFVQRNPHCTSHLRDFLPSSSSFSSSLSTFLYATLPSPLLHLLCVLLGLFEQAASPRPSNAALLWSFLPFALLPFFLMHSTALRRPSPLALLWPALVGLAGQLVGISIAFPLFWLVHYFLSPPNPENAKNPPSRAKFVSLFLAFLCFGFNVVSLFVLRTPDLRAWSILLFQIAPIFPGIIALCTPSFLSPSLASPSRTFSAVYLLLGGVGLLGHVLAVCALIDEPQAVHTIWRVLQAAAISGPEYVDYMLWIDFLSTLASVAIFVLFDLGVGAFLAFVLLSPLLSPGLVLAYLLSKREQRFEVPKLKSQ